MTEAKYRIRWTDGNDAEFDEFHSITENYYDQLVGGHQNRQSFVSGNLSKDIKYAMIVYSDEDVPSLSAHGRCHLLWEGAVRNY